MTRERGTLVTERMGHVNCIEGLPATQGVFDFEPVRIDHRKWVERLHRIAIRCCRCESGAASRTRSQLVTLEAECVEFFKPAGP